MGSSKVPSGVRGGTASGVDGVAQKQRHRVAEVQDRDLVALGVDPSQAAGRVRVRGRALALDHLPQRARDVGGLGATHHQRPPGAAQGGAQRGRVGAVTGDVADDDGHFSVLHVQNVQEVAAQLQPVLAGYGVLDDGQVLVAQLEIRQQAALEPPVKRLGLGLRLGPACLRERQRGLVGEPLHQGEHGGVRHRRGHADQPSTSRRSAARPRPMGARSTEPSPSALESLARPGPSTWWPVSARKLGMRRRISVSRSGSSAIGKRVDGGTAGREGEVAITTSSFPSMA